LACFWPEASVELLQVARAGNVQELLHFHARVVRPIYALRQRRGGYEVAVMKTAMELLGHPAGVARPPLGNVTQAERAELAKILTRLHVPTAADRVLSARAALSAIA
jgi:dihydrodipicolinate synthase/N-acetylneuraminate lyase